MERTPEVERLQEIGCSVLCLGCPEGVLFGIDYSAWAVGPRFMGVKLVPPGLHYVYTSPSAEDVGVVRTGFFAYMKPQDVVVFKWDPESEELARLLDQDEELRYADAVRGFEFDAHLGPYPLALSEQWQELTRHASPKIVQKVEPLSRLVRSKRAEYDVIVPAAGDQKGSGVIAPSNDVMHVDLDEMDGDELAQPEPAQQQPQQEQQQQQQQQQSPQQQHEPRVESNQEISGTLFFSAVPRPRKHAGASAAETTQMHMDRTGQLDEMVKKEYDDSELCILGELQLAYIAFLLGQNYDGFEQWRSLLGMLCSCEAAVAKRPNLFEELCRTFYAQLSQAPSDLFGDDITRENFLGDCAVSLLELCDSEVATSKLRKRCGKLRSLVQEKFGLSIDDLALLGGDAPLIVDADGRDLVDL